MDRSRVRLRGDVCFLSFGVLTPTPVIKETQSTMPVINFLNERSMVWPRRCMPFPMELIHANIRCRKGYADDLWPRDRRGKSILGLLNTWTKVAFA